MIAERKRDKDKMTKTDDNALLHNKIRELEEELARGKSQFMKLHYVAMAEYSAIRVDERRKVAEDCISEASKYITTKWRRDAMEEVIRAKYLKDTQKAECQPAPEAKP